MREKNDNTGEAKQGIQPTQKTCPWEKLGVKSKHLIGNGLGAGVKMHLCVVGNRSLLIFFRSSGLYQKYLTHSVAINFTIATWRESKLRMDLGFITSWGEVNLKPVKNRYFSFIYLEISRGESCLSQSSSACDLSLPVWLADTFLPLHSVPGAGELGGLPASPFPAQASPTCCGKWNGELG